MLLAPLLMSALALTNEAPRPLACELAPTLGSGDSDEGEISTLSTLGFNCHYQLMKVFGLGLSPELGVKKASWSINTGEAGQKNLSSYETQDLLVGLRVERPISDKVSVFYRAFTGQGLGSVNTTRSTETSSLQGSFSSLRQSQLSHTLGASFAINVAFAWSLAWQTSFAKQSWQATESDFSAQAVADDLSMSLTTAQGTNLLGSSIRQTNQTKTHAIELGLSLRFGSSR